MAARRTKYDYAASAEIFFQRREIIIIKTTNLKITWRGGGRVNKIEILEYIK